MDVPPAYLEAARAVAKDIPGPILFGSFLSVLFFGVLITQYNLYWRSSQKDPIAVKALVLLVALFSTAQCALCLAISYHYTISSFGNVTGLNNIYKPDAAMVCISALQGGLVQSFFAYRVRKLTGQILLPIGVWCLAAAEVGLIIFCTVRIRQIGHWQGLSDVRPQILAFCAASPVADILVSAALIFYLRRHRTGFAATDDFLTRLSRLTLQTGSITVVWTITDLILYLVYSKQLNAFILLYPLGMVYCLCMMSSLNARVHWDPSTNYMTSTANSHSHQTWSNQRGGGHGLQILKTSATSATGDVELGPISPDPSRLSAYPYLTSSRPVSNMNLGGLGSLGGTPQPPGTPSTPGFDFGIVDDKSVPLSGVPGLGAGGAASKERRSYGFVAAAMAQATKEEESRREARRANGDDDDDDDSDGEIAVHAK